MSKKVKVLISILIATLLLTIGSVTMVMAEGEEETTPPSEATKQSLLERVAEILEINQEDLIDAFKQAQQEMNDEAFIKHLNQAVASGHITQEQADDIIEWWELRPDDEIRDWRELMPEAIKPSMMKRAMRFRASPGFHMRNGHGGEF